MLKTKSDQLRASLGLQLGHPVSQGDLGEGEWLAFLNDFLPKRYAASKGFVFDSAYVQCFLIKNGRCVVRSIEFFSTLNSEFN